MTKAEVFLKPSGLLTPQPGFREPGSNGLTRDARGRLLLCQHGERRVARYEKGTFTSLADRYEGKRFNSPNDLVFHPSGDLYFTDPPYGLEGLNDSKAKELPFNGVYRLKPNGDLALLLSDLTFPNGIGISPDGRTLYVAVSDPAKPLWMAYDIHSDGTVARGRVFFDPAAFVAQHRIGSCDGLKVDRDGNLFATGPGGVFVFTPSGRHLGTIVTGEPTANVGFGDDGSTLYMTANNKLMRIRLRTKGLGF